MKKVITSALCKLDSKGGSPQLGINSNEKKFEIYLKNCFVALKSARLHNPDVDVCLVVNVNLSDEWRNIFERNAIEVITYEERYFVFPSNFIWAAAYYKLDAFMYLSNIYDAVILLDTDTFTVGSYEGIWHELDQSILLFDTNHKSTHPHRMSLSKNYEEIYNVQVGTINHWGGEFIAAKGDLLKSFVNSWKEIYQHIIKNIEKYEHDMGDEQILSIAAYFMRENVLSANKYLFRFWTTGRNYLTSTIYKFNKVDIWHLPSEKDAGMLYLYKYYNKHNAFPQDMVCIRKFGLDKTKPNYFKIAYKNIKKHMINRMHN